MLVYTNSELLPQKICTNNVVSTASEICNGLEFVSIRMLHDLLPGTVFICDDNFIVKSDYQENLIGTILYDNISYKIMGPICIVKCINTHDGYGYTGFNTNEIEILVNGINSLLDINKHFEDTYVYQRLFNTEITENALIKSLVFKCVNYLNKHEPCECRENYLLNLLDQSEGEWILNELFNDMQKHQKLDEKLVYHQANLTLHYAETLAKEIWKRKVDQHVYSQAII